MIYVLATACLLFLLSLTLDSWILLLLSLSAALLPLVEVLMGRAVLSLMRVRLLPRDHELYRLLDFVPAGWEVMLGVRRGPPAAYAAQTGFRSGVVVLNDGILDILTDDELGAVLAHEVGHLVEHHSLIRIAALALSVINIPVGTMLGAALSRRLEYRADEFSVVSTGSPHSLASALVKVVAARSGYSILSGFSPSLNNVLALFSWTPSLESRLRRIEEFSSKVCSR